MIRVFSIAIILVVAMAFISPAVSSAEDEFIIGLIPEENIFTQIKKHKPLEEYLTKRLGVRVQFTILSRYPDIIDRFVSRNMDGAFFGIFTSILAQEKLGVVPLARPVNIDGRSTANAYIFVRKDSGISGAADMKGKRAVFVDKATATGYLYLLAYLRERGVRNFSSFFSQTTFTGSHDSTVYSVLSGRADVGVAKARIFEKLKKRDPLIGEELLILSKSGDLPDTTLCVRRDVAPELKKRLKEALLSLHNDSEGREVLRALEAIKFVSADTEDYTVVKDLAVKAGFGNLKEYDYR